VTPVRVGVVVAVLLAVATVIAAQEAIANADGGAKALAAGAAAVFGFALGLPRTPVRRAVVLPALAIAVALLAVHASSTGVPAAVFGVFCGYFLANLVRVTRRLSTLARRQR
jgi:hypothetical protein